MNTDLSKSISIIRDDMNDRLDNIEAIKGTDARFLMESMVNASVMLKLVMSTASSEIKYLLAEAQLATELSRLQHRLGISNELFEELADLEFKMTMSMEAATTRMVATIKEDVAKGDAS